MALGFCHEVVKKALFHLFLWNEAREFLASSFYWPFLLPFYESLVFQDHLTIWQNLLKYVFLNANIISSIIFEPKILNAFRFKKLYCLWFFNLLKCCILDMVNPLWVYLFFLHSKNQCIIYEIQYWCTENTIIKTRHKKPKPH